MELSDLATSWVKKNWKTLTSLALILGLCTSAVFLSSSFRVQLSKKVKPEPQLALSSFPVSIPNIKYGLAIDTFTIHSATIQPNQFLSDLLMGYGVSYETVEGLVTNAKDEFDVRTLRAGKPYHILNRDTSTAPDFFIYEPDAYGYVKFDLNQKKVAVVKHPIDVKIVESSGIIESSLWNAMVDNDMEYDLAVKMEDAFAWSIDFHHIQQKDKFKLVYEQQIIDGKPVGSGKILAAYFQHFGNDFHAIYFENERHSGFYDLEARPMKKAFLKSPVKYSRISSRFNPRRYHPVLKRVRPHRGTDYAAPHGTPIMAVADGIVTQVSYSRGNGKFVKIRHDKTYQTQYLHMSRFAKGMKPGVKVKQSEVIGYVGSTGLATGPHVCFRFWKNGRQVDPLRQNLPPPDPMPESDIPAFNLVKDIYKSKLDGISIPAKRSIDDLAKMGIKDSGKHI